MGDNGYCNRCGGESVCDMGENGMECRDTCPDCKGTGLKPEKTDIQWRDKSLNCKPGKKRTNKEIKETAIAPMLYAILGPFDFDDEPDYDKDSGAW